MLNFETCKFKDYEIDTYHNNKIFSVFEECIDILLKNNIEFMVGGSIGLILNTNKIYRNIGDIDFNILNSLDPNQIDVFKKNNFSLLNFRKLGKNLLSKNNVVVEFNFLIIDYKSIFKNSKNFDYITSKINLLSVNDIFLGKKKSMQNEIRQKDLDDMEFYSKYI